MPASFEELIRAANVYSSSELVPALYRGPKGQANSMIAIEMAARLGLGVLEVMQNLYVVNGNPAWKSSFVIGIINSSGRFPGGLQFQLDGQGDDRGCVAFAKTPSGEVVSGPRVSLGMARAEGWIGRKGSKWATMPEVMLRYRAAAFFGRMVVPELLMGAVTADEAMDAEFEVAIDQGVGAEFEPGGVVDGQAFEVDRYMERARVHHEALRDPTTSLAAAKRHMAHLAALREEMGAPDFVDEIAAGAYAQIVKETRDGDEL